MTTDQITVASFVVGLASSLGSLYLLRWSRKVVRGGLILLKKANERTRNAELACELLRKDLMRGSAVGRWHRAQPAPNADEWYHHVITTEGPLLLTDEAWQAARQRAGKLLK